MTKENEDEQLTNEQRELFDAITSGRYTNLALVAGKFQGHSVAYICALNPVPGEPEDVLVLPMAMLVPQDFLVKFGDQMQDPEGNRPSNGNNPNKTSPEDVS